MGAATVSAEQKIKRRTKRARHRPMAEINVTPFVDVMLVLLIIFMVAAPLLTVGVPLELPKTAALPLPGEDEEPLTLALSLDGRLLLQATEIKRGALIPKLRAIAAQRSSDKIFLRADSALPYGQVMQVMGALNAGGFHNVALVTDAGGPALNDVAE